jgi:hypothetical protein
VAHSSEENLIKCTRDCALWQFSVFVSEPMNGSQEHQAAQLQGHHLYGKQQRYISQLCDEGLCWWPTSCPESSFLSLPPLSRLLPEAQKQITSLRKFTGERSKVYALFCYIVLQPRAVKECYRKQISP